MRQPISVASVTIAHNSAKVLPRQIDALLLQTRALGEIIVVDNASTDATASVMAMKYPQAKLLRLSENLGAGGALAAGLRYAALVKRHDWVWTFDDDSVPRQDALEALLNAFDFVGGDDSSVGMLASLAVHDGTGTCYPPFLWRNGQVRPDTEQLRQRVCFADLVITSGCLIRREVVEKIGLPRADFFMDFIDSEYCLRTRSAGYKIGVVPGSELKHELGNARWVRLPGYSRLRAEYPPWREYYIARNMTYAVWWLYSNLSSKLFVARMLLRRAAGVLVFGPDKFARLKRMAQGFWDGRRARLGIRFRPS